MFIKQNLINALRFLSVDAVDKAKSGHPGMPLGMADIAATLWLKFLKHNPQNPKWHNRDRFVLSNGHGSMLLYALLHLTGYNLTIDDLKQFRQLNSKTPGHPEYRYTPGVETTTGPLGQGLANAVGLALGEKILGAQFNKPQYKIIDHFTYAFVGDGCLMEGISHEAASLAGTLGLEKLIVFYDKNGISIDGNVNQWFTEDVSLRFTAYNWQVIDNIDGHHPEEIAKAIIKAQEDLSRPTLIICNTIIGFGSTLAGSEKSHGSPLGQTNIKVLRENLEWQYAEFEIPEEIYKDWNSIDKGSNLENTWLQLCAKYKNEYPEDYNELLRRLNGDLPDNWLAETLAFIEESHKQNTELATRKTSQLCLDYYGKLLPELLGGSADLTVSNNTNHKNTKVINSKDFTGNYINYGVREFAMAAIMNGLSLHDGFIPYGGTFLVFSDYARNAIRLSAFMQIRVIYVLTHDSIGLGEDGPTHQPIEHLEMLRMTPNLNVWRPADLTETAIAWKVSLETHNAPSCLILSRQNLPVINSKNKNDSIYGAYIAYEPESKLQALIIATGSEVHLAIEAAKILATENIALRVVSMPCVSKFLTQPKNYQEKILPPNITKRVAIEAACTKGWYQFVGLDGLVLGIDSFGASGKAEDLYKYFGLTIENIVESTKKLIKGEK